MSAPREASSAATTAPMRLPPVMSATLPWSSMARGSIHDPRFTRALVSERPEERRALERVAPLRAKRRAVEHVAFGLPQRRLLDGRQRVEPLHAAALRVVFRMLVHVERYVPRREADGVVVLGKRDRRRRDL